MNGSDHLGDLVVEVATFIELKADMCFFFFYLIKRHAVKNMEKWRCGSTHP